MNVFFKHETIINVVLFSIVQPLQKKIILF
jgi:hypothetical protein